MPFTRSKLGVCFRDDFSSLGVNDVVVEKCSLDLLRINGHRLDLRLAKRFDVALCELFRVGAASDNRLARTILGRVSKMQTHEPFRRLEVQLTILNDGLLRGVEHPQHFGIGETRPLYFVFEVRISPHAVDVYLLHQTERPKENRSQEFAFAIDAHVEQVLGVVFELNPRAPIRDDLSQKVGVVVLLLKKHSGRAVELADYHALSSVDDERSVVGHQRNLAEEDFFFLDVANRLLTGVLVGVPDRQANLDLQRDSEGHRLLLTFLFGMLVL